MFIIQGKFNEATIFTDNVEATAIAQIYNLCNQESLKDSVIKIMPDTHAGAGCVIGTVMTIQDKIIPNLVGVDIGCGMEVAYFNADDLDLEKLDKVIREHIPFGFNVRAEAHINVKQVELDKLKCRDFLQNKDRLELALGTLGGGNHFIEVCKSYYSRYDYALVVHTGSRNLGKQVCEYYQKKAVELHPEVPKELAYLDGSWAQDYLHDMQIVQHYAEWNRKTIVETITSQMRWPIRHDFTTIHNYIDTKKKILRKGAVSAEQDELLIIPMNMRDGSIIAAGYGNKEWLCSAPHGAGRLMSRGEAKRQVNLEEYKDSMKNIWTTCVNESTIDESPMAYKPMDEILENIKETVYIKEVITPIYNFKAN